MPAHPMGHGSAKDPQGDQMDARVQLLAPHDPAEGPDAFGLLPEDLPAHIERWPHIDAGQTPMTFVDRQGRQRLLGLPLPDQKMQGRIDRIPVTEVSSSVVITHALALSPRMAMGTKGIAGRSCTCRHIGYGHYRANR